MWVIPKPSSVFARESVGSISASSMDCEAWAKMLERSAWWRGKCLAWQSWRRKCKPGSFANALSGLAISQPSQKAACEAWIGSRVGTHANPSRQQDNEKGQRMNAISGRSSRESLPMCGLLACSLKTSQVMSQWGCKECCPIWKDSVSDARGDCLERSKSEHLTAESAFSSSAWPTPDCTMRPHEGNVRLLRNAVDLGLPKSEADAMLGRDISLPQGKLPLWPTATAGDSKSSGSAKYQTSSGRHAGTTLTDAVVRKWPTPTARDFKSGLTSEATHQRNSRPLNETVVNYPTPTVGDSDKQPTDSLHHLVIGKGPGSHPGQLNPEWVEALMGFSQGWTACALSGMP